MKILYDGFIYRDQKVGGINRYFENIICRLDQSDIPMMLKVQDDDTDYPSHPRMKTYYANKFHFKPFGLAERLNRFNRFYISRCIHPDLIHPTFFSLLTGQKINEWKCPVVITVHDMISELYPELADPNGKEAAMKEKAIMVANAIICVSENTKLDLLKFYPEVEDKVTVIHHGVSLKPEPKFSLDIKRQYYLFVGSRFPYKNFDFLLKALSRFLIKQNDVVLSVVGAPFTKEESKLIADLKLAKNIYHHGFVSDKYLAALYAQSLAFIYPSLYEGFGLPSLEAMACGTPVIAANDSCFPEVIGDAGILFSADSIDNLVDAMLLVYRNASCREQLIAKGYSRVSEFTWDTTVAKTTELYRALIAGRV